MVEDDETGCHKVGDPIVGQAPAVFELVVSDHVQRVNPKDFGLEREGIDPYAYFITSGDAVEKARVLDHDLWQLAGSLRKELFQIIADENNCDNAQAQNLYRSGVRPRSRFHEYEAAVWKAAGQARKMFNALLTAKGENCFLETEWDSHRLLCIPKNPRK